MADTITSIVDKLSSFGLIRTNKVSGDWYQCYCPIHNEGKERKPSFGISIHDQVRNGKKYPAGGCHCFSCGYVNTLRGLVEDILKNRKVSIEAVKWIEDNVPELGHNIEYDKLVDPKLTESLVSSLIVNDLKSHMRKEPTYVSEEELASYRFIVPYMYERKLTDEIIEKFDVGFDKDWIPPGRKKPVPCITFPVHDYQGRTLFICRRSIQGKLYNYPAGVTKPVYGIDMIPKDCKSVIVCESIINALTLWTWGYVAVALLGTGNDYQITQLQRLGAHELVLCMDGDEAGSRATDRLKNQLKSVCLISRIKMIEGKDVNDIDKNTFDSLYKGRY